MVQKAMAGTTSDAKVKGFFLFVGGVILLVLTFWAAGFIIDEVLPRAVRRFFDTPVLDFILNFRTGSLTPIMKFFSIFGSTAFGLIALLGMAFYSYVATKDARFPIFYIVMALGAFVLDDVVKQLVSVPRPPVRQLVSAGGPSFPSGHTAAAAAVAYAIAFFIIERQPTRRIVWVWPAATILAILVGFSRCYLGVAWPTDVLAGYAMGVGYGAVAGAAVKTFFGYHRLSPRRAVR